jgi:hypothetical protein
MTQADSEASWTKALEAAKQAYTTHAAKLKRKDLVTVINYDTLNKTLEKNLDHPDRLRVYDARQNWKKVRSAWVSHAEKSAPTQNNQCATVFSNTEGSKLSSRGAYVTDPKLHTSNRWGFPALNVEGLEPGINHLARKRTIKFHKAIDKRDGKDVPIGLSWGCFMTRPDVNEALTKQIMGGTLVYVYSSAPPKASK